MGQNQRWGQSLRDMTSNNGWLDLEKGGETKKVPHLSGFANQT
jgi:hypothetical protein